MRIRAFIYTEPGWVVVMSLVQTVPNNIKRDYGQRERLGVAKDVSIWKCFLLCVQRNRKKITWIHNEHIISLNCSCWLEDTLGGIRTIPYSIWNGTSCWHEWRVDQSRGSLCQSAQYVPADECCCSCSRRGCLWTISYGRKHIACHLNRMRFGSLGKATYVI